MVPDKRLSFSISASGPSVSIPSGLSYRAGVLFPPAAKKIGSHPHSSEERTMPINSTSRRRIISKVFTTGISILLAVCFVAQWGNAFAGQRFARSIDLLTAPAPTPDFVAALAEQLPVRDFIPAPDSLAPTTATRPAAGFFSSAQTCSGPSAQRSSKVFSTPALPRPPPASPFALR